MSFYSYKLPSAKNQHLTFHEKGFWLKVILFFAIITIPTLVASVALLLQPSELLQKTVPVGFSLLAVGFNALILGTRRSKIILFHNDHQRIYFLSNKKQDFATAPSFPYADFDKFMVSELRIDRDQSWIFDLIRSPYKIVWNLLLTKRDGGRWILCRYRSEEKARTIYEQFNQSVEIRDDAPPERVERIL